MLRNTTKMPIEKVQKIYGIGLYYIKRNSLLTFNPFISSKHFRRMS